MKVQCNKCEKKYNIPEEKIPENGINLKCKECNATIWVQRDNAKQHQSSDEIISEDNQPCNEESVTNDKRKTKSSVTEISDNIKDSVKYTAQKVKNTLNDTKSIHKNHEYRMNKTLIGKIEQKVLFNYTRVFSLLTIGVLLICLTIGVFAYLNVENTSHVTYSDVEKTLNPPENNTSKSLQDKFPEVDIPTSVSRYFNDGDNKQVFTGWLAGLEEDQKRDFINNLEAIIEEAEDQNPGKVTDYINGYKTIKLAKISSGQFDKYYQTATKVGIITLILAIMGIIGLFCLVLVVLAVERNTRPTVQIEE